MKYGKRRIDDGCTPQLPELTNELKKSKEQKPTTYSAPFFMRHQKRQGVPYPVPRINFGGSHQRKNKPKVTLAGGDYAKGRS
jgi:hypothetical protein